MSHQEAQLRRDRSLAILLQEGIAVPDDAAILEGDPRRSATEIADRAMALCLVAARGDGLENMLAALLVEYLQLEKVLTAAESNFMIDPTPSEAQKRHYLWRYEGYWVLLWALRFVDMLGRPDEICDIPTALRALRERGRATFVEQAQLRPAEEILDAADLTYRYHWTVCAANANGHPPPGRLQARVVRQRQQAFSWLIDPQRQSWAVFESD